MRLVKILHHEVLYICHELTTILPLRCLTDKEENQVHYIFQALLKINTKPITQES